MYGIPFDCALGKTGVAHRQFFQVHYNQSAIRILLGFCSPRAAGHIVRHSLESSHPSQIEGPQEAEKDR